MFIIMSHYLLLVRYDHKWHIYYAVKDDIYKKDSEKDHLWLIEAARFAVELLGIRKPGCNLVEEIQIFPLLLREKPDMSAELELQKIPVDGIKDIKLTDNE